MEDLPPESSTEGRVSAEGANLNGANLNGANLNGANLNGANLNGPELNSLLVSVAFEGARRGGQRGKTLEAVWLEGAVFHGLMGTHEISGHDFSGVFFNGTLGSGQRVTLRVDSVHPGTGDSRDVWSYAVSALDSRDGRWYPICQRADGTAAEAIPVEGRWDYRQGVPGGGSKTEDPNVFTFACEGAAIAKCVHYGYKPWARGANGESLASYHQACTRLIRADFCGDGTSFTVDGQWVNLYDTAGVQLDTEEWVPEAEWTPDGARCFTAKTRAHRPVVCANGRVKPACSLGESFGEGAMMVSETPPALGRQGR